MRKTAEHRDKTYKSANGIIKNGFVGGIIILTVSNLLVKVTGLLFKIPMNYIMGDTGMGYYNSAYSIYTLFYMLSTSGLPVAISVTVSEKRAQGKIGSAKKVFHLALAVFAAIGLLAFALMFFASDKLALLISSELSAMSIAAAAPTILFVCVSGAYRGYFQGCGNMMPTAVSQLIEAMGKLLIGIACALYAIRRGAEIHVVAAYAVFGLTAGSFVGMLYLIITGFVRGDRDLVTEHEIYYTSDKTGSIFKRFLAISIPVTLSASVMSLTNTLDTAMIQRILILSGMTAEEATAAYGNYTSLAVPLFNLPPVLIYPIAYSLVPAVAAAAGEGKIEAAKEKITMSLRYALIIGLPCAMGLSALSDPILCLLYNDTSAHAAAMLLTLLAPSSLLVCILAITNSVLQGCGKEKMPVISMLVGGGVKLLSGMLLIKLYGISGAPMSTFLCYLTVTVMNLAFTVRYTKVHLTPGMLYKPLLSAVVCSLSAVLVNSILKPVLGSSPACVSSVLVAAVVYLTMLILLGEVSLTNIKNIIKSKSKIKVK